MNIKLHTPKSLKAGSGMASLKQFLLSIPPSCAWKLIYHPVPFINTEQTSGEVLGEFDSKFRW